MAGTTTKRKNRVTIELRPLCMGALKAKAAEFGMTVKDYSESFFEMALLHDQGASLKLTVSAKVEPNDEPNREPELPLDVAGLTSHDVVRYVEGFEPGEYLISSMMNAFGEQRGMTLLPSDRSLFGKVVGNLNGRTLQNGILGVRRETGGEVRLIISAC